MLSDVPRFCERAANFLGRPTTDGCDIVGRYLVVGFGLEMTGCKLGDGAMFFGCFGAVVVDRGRSNVVLAGNGAAFGDE